MIQTPGWFISTMAETRSAVPSQSTGTRRRIRHGISIQRDDLKGMTGQRQAANLSRASIQDMKQNALALLHADRLPWPSMRPLMVNEP